MKNMLEKEKMNIQEVAAWMTITSLIFSALKFCYGWFYNWLTTPVVVWGFFDCPNSLESHYYLIVKPHWSKKSKQDLSLILDFHGQGPTDCTIMVTEFYRRTGHEHMHVLPCSDTSTKTNMRLSYQLEIGVEYRIIVQVPGGRVGTSPFDYCGLNIEALGAKTKKVHHKLPF